MPDRTKIPWAEATWNPMTGCSPISEACEHCYAERIARRFAVKDQGLDMVQRMFAPFTPTFHPDRLEVPLHWRKPRRIFVCSMSDLFHEAFTDEEISSVLATVALCSQHCFMVLTKRPERMRSYLGGNWTPMVLEQFQRTAPPHVGPGFVQGRLPNLWLGVTVENQARADERIPILLDTPAAVRFVSLEPLLGPVDLRWVYAQPRSHFPPSGRQTVTFDEPPDWVIVGGETGPGAQPMEPAWALDVYRQCKAANVPFFWKARGTYWDRHPDPDLWLPDSSQADFDDAVTMEWTRDFPEATP